MDLRIKDKDIEFYTDDNGFLNIKTVTGSEEIIERLEKLVSMNLGSHVPRKKQGIPWEKLLKKEITISVLESKIYEELSNDLDIDSNSIEIDLNFDGRVIKLNINAMTKSGKNININKTGGE